MSALDNSPLISGREVPIRLTGTSDEAFSCILLRTGGGKIYLRSDRWIEPATRVSAIFAHITVFGEVVYCTRNDNWYRICIALIAEDDRRGAPRIPVRQTGTIIALSGEGSESFEGILLDLSDTGMRLEMAHRLETGTMIFFVTKSATVAAEVRYCQQRRSGHFEAGVEIRDIRSDIDSQRKLPEAPSDDPGKKASHSSGS